MRGRPRTIQAGGYVLWTSGEILGQCVKCGQDAAFYNDNGDLMCDEHLVDYFEDEEDEEDDAGIFGKHFDSRAGKCRYCQDTGRSDVRLHFGGAGIFRTWRSCPFCKRDDRHELETRESKV